MQASLVIYDINYGLFISKLALNNYKLSSALPHLKLLNQSKTGC
jgi:hypothetical protein